jgi:hypothetical protein
MEFAGSLPMGGRTPETTPAEIPAVTRVEILGEILEEIPVVTPVVILEAIRVEIPAGIPEEMSHRPGSSRREWAWGR